MTDHRIRAAVWQPMVARDPGQSHRAATPLELLVDLSFVVAVAQIAAELHHDVTEAHIAHALPGYLMVFFAIWWAWMNFTWFASAFDVDDVAYRLLTFLQITGVLVLAAGVPKAFGSGEFGAIVVGYVLMRLAMVAQWLRAARSVETERSVAIRYALGIALVQIAWIAWLWVPEGAPLYVGFVVLALVEMAIPWWAEHAGPMTPWHPSHIAERYALFTIIVIGESILAGTITVQSAFTSHGLSWSLIAVALGGLAIVFAVWWCYFARESDEFLRGADHKAFLWGYGHYFVFAAIAAVGAGLQVVADTDEHTSHLDAVPSAYAVAVPLAVYFVAVGALHTGVDPERPVAWRYGFSAVGVLVIAASASFVDLAITIVATALFLAATVAFGLRADARHDAAGQRDRRLP